MSRCQDDFEACLVTLVRSSLVLMRALRAARTVDPPDWLIGAGAIRDRVWDHLHGFAPAVPSRDLDLVFFDQQSLGSERERSVQREVNTEAPDICWDVTNQAAVHLWYPEVFGLEVEPLTSSADGVSTWPETATAVGVRLLENDSIQVVAPCGLEDLFGLVCRRNPRRVTPEHYRARVKSKQIAERWPRVQILDASD
jgi:hypothetical protein